MAKIDVNVVNQATEKANVDIRKAVEGKHWSKAEQGSSRLSMSLAASKRAGEQIKTPEIERKQLKK